MEWVLKIIMGMRLYIGNIEIVIGQPSKEKMASFETCTLDHSVVLSSCQEDCRASSSEEHSIFDGMFLSFGSKSENSFYAVERDLWPN